MHRSIKGARIVLGGLFLVGVALAGVARADNAEMTAREDFAAGRYDRALEEFAKLYARTLNPVYLRNIGRCHQKLREPDKAIDSFHDYLAKGKKISPEERTEIEGYIKEMEALRAEQSRQAAPPPPPPVQPIEPVPAPADARTTSAPSHLPEPQAQPPASGTTSGTLIAQPSPPPGESPPFYTRWWFWTIVGAAVLGGVAATIALSGGTSRPPCTSSSNLDILTCK
jgi:hypothetical protein